MLYNIHLCAPFTVVKLTAIFILYKGGKDTQIVKYYYFSGGVGYN